MRFIADITILAFKWWLNEIRCRFLSQRVMGVLHNAPMKKQPQSEKPNLYLVGFMGVGKSAIGRKVAKELGFQFIDSDHEIERKVGKKIPQIFESEGEARFRQYEREFIEGSGDRYNELYAGVNYFFYDHKFKLQLGGQYNDLAGGGDDGGDHQDWGITAGFRMSW